MFKKLKLLRNGAYFGQNSAQSSAVNKMNTFFYYEQSFSLVEVDAFYLLHQPAFNVVVFVESVPTTVHSLVVDEVDICLSRAITSS